jgi:LacI family transcriptional regulator
MNLTQPTTQQIADKLKLAKTTVAGILRGYPGFNEQTRERVLSTARKMGYRPNPLSRALAGGKSMSIGFMAGSLEPMLLSRLHAVEHGARAAGYNTLVVFAAGRIGEFTPDDALGLLDRRVDGLVVHGIAPLTPDINRILGQTATPIVYVSRSPLPHARFQVVIDHEPGVRAAAEHLASLGHKSAHFLAVDYDRRYPKERLGPTRDWFAAAGVKLVSPKEWTVPLGETIDPFAATYELVGEQVRTAAPPTAIYVGDDELAAAIMAALRDAGLRVPEDVSVLGHDDISFARYITPGLSTIREPSCNAGLAAFELLNEVMDKPDAEPRTITLPTQFVQRGSTGPARK